MAFTANKNLEQPARGAYVGTWDTPVNSNTGIIDNSLGGVATVALTNSNVTLASGQYQCVYIVFTGTITANIQITFPAVGSFYTIQNRTTGNFTITMTTTAAGGEVIACPPYEPFDILTDGTNVRYRNFGRIGSYWDYAGSSVPAWVTACTVPPYLHCNGTTFSSATYPALATIFGGTTLPDSQGRVRAALDGGTGRITSSQSGIAGTTLFAAGGTQTRAISSANLPSYNLDLTNATFTSSGTEWLKSTYSAFPTVASGSNFSGTPRAVTNGSAVTGTLGGTIPLGGSGSSMILMNPTYIGGITLVRAA